MMRTQAEDDHRYPGAMRSNLHPYTLIWFVHAGTNVGFTLRFEVSPPRLHLVDTASSMRQPQSWHQRDHQPKESTMAPDLPCNSCHRTDYSGNR